MAEKRQSRKESIRESFVAALRPYVRGARSLVPFTAENQEIAEVINAVLMRAWRKVEEDFSEDEALRDAIKEVEGPADDPVGIDPLGLRRIYGPQWEGLIERTTQWLNAVPGEVGIEGLNARVAAQMADKRVKEGKPKGPEGLNEGATAEDDLLKELMGGQQEPPIGVPEGYVAQRDVSGVAPSALLSGYPTEARPRYREGDEFGPASLGPEKIAELQRRLAASGLLRGEFRIGWWDEATRMAYKQALGMANQIGATDSQVLKELAATEAERRADLFNQAWQPEPYLPPDPARLREDARRFLEGTLGRKVRDDEIDDMVRHSSEIDRRSHEVEQQINERVARAQLDNQLATPFDEPQEADLSGLQDVDPEAQFVSAFREKYQPELDRRQRVEESFENSATLMESIFAMDRGVR